MKPTSYCLDTSQPFDRGSSKPLEGRYDVAVVCNNGFAQNHAVMAGKDAANALYKAFDAGVDMVEVMDGRPISTPGRTSTGRRSPDNSGAPGSYPSSARTTA